MRSAERSFRNAIKDMQVLPEGADERLKNPKKADPDCYKGWTTTVRDDETEDTLIHWYTTYAVAVEEKNNKNRSRRFVMD